MIMKNKQITVWHISFVFLSLLIVSLLNKSDCLQITRPWTTQHWCKSVINPKWPFAYAKYHGQKEEPKGRVSTNAQDMRHECQTQGVQSKCHICEEIACGENNHQNQTCHFQIQGVDWRDMSTNIPTITDMPWAVGGRHRFDFGGNSTTHVCLFLSSNDDCQTNFGVDYSNCPLRCWGYNTTFQKDIFGYFAVPTRSSMVQGINSTYSEKDDLLQEGIWPNHLHQHNNVISHQLEGYNSTPWTLPLPTATWEYPKSAIMDKAQNPKVYGNWSLLPQGGTFTLAGSRNSQKGFVDGNTFSARFNTPEGVTVDHEGYVYVADTGNHAIRMVSPMGNVTTIAGTGNPGFQDTESSFQNMEQFSYPSDIVFWRDWENWDYRNPIDLDSFLVMNGKGRHVLFVADTGNHCIRKITGDIRYDPVQGEKTWENVNVTCFSGSACGNVNEKSPRPGYADGERHEARFDSPRGITVSSGGHIFVADTNNHLVREIDRFGTTKTIAGSLILAETTITGSTLEGCSSPCLSGVQGSEDGPFNKSKFSYPSSLAMTKGENELYVTDRHHLRSINLSSQVVSTLAGGEEEGERDGQGSESSLNKPDAVTVTADGIAYIGDAVSCRIRRVSSPRTSAQQVSCSETLSSIFRPSGCTSYNPSVDKYGMKMTPVESNVYHNYQVKNLYDENLGLDFVGRGTKDCVGSPPKDVLDKRFWNDTATIYPFNENLVIDDELKNVREDPNQGTVLKVICPKFCNNDLEVFGGTKDKESSKTFYSEYSSVCGAAIHSGFKSEGTDDIIDIMIHRGNNQKVISGIFQNGIRSHDISNSVSRLFSLSKSSFDKTVQTISGSPTNMIGYSCGYHDSLPSQEAKFGTPTGIAAYTNSTLNDHSNFLFVADRNNHVIRGISSTCMFPCENGGRCIGSDLCECPDGWRGVDCTRPQCSSDCGDRKLCVAPNICSCVPGYNGFDCTETQCVQTCENGGQCIAPDTCSCSPGWFDSNCTTPICGHTCGNGGNCTAPNTCTCPLEWGGTDCRTPVCEQECMNGGWCIAPNTCACPPQWSGFDCSIPICHQGYFVPFSFQTKQKYQHFPRHWLQYEPCHFDTWCNESNGFDCKQHDRIASAVKIKNGKKWRFKTGRKTEPHLCAKVELSVNIVSKYQYLRARDNTTTSFHRYTPKTLHNWISIPRQAWNAYDVPEFSLTQPWKYLLDRQVALVTLYNTTQGRYVCANGGECIVPDTCVCAPGWIGFDCRTPVCEQGFFEPDQTEFVKGTNSENELESFEFFLGNNTYRLNPHRQSGTGYSNPKFNLWQETYINESEVKRVLVEKGGIEYLTLEGKKQGGYSCSIRSVTEWEDYRSGSVLDHPNYFSRFMDSKVEMDGKNYTSWEGMQWKPTHKKSSKRKIGIQDFLTKYGLDFIPQIDLHGPNRGSRLNNLTQFVYTDKGYMSNGIWTLTGENWTKGSCIIEFERICENEKEILDLEAAPRGLNVRENHLFVQDTDLAFRSRITYDDKKAYPFGTWDENENKCQDRVIRGCFNNGTCVAPNVCECATEWTGYDCSKPICSQKCLHNGNCTHPGICTCEKGWTGYDCSVPICSQNCNNFGTCVAPDTCKCEQWPNEWRDNQVAGGVPLFQKPNGDPQMTGWTGYDCSVPICVQAERFRLNVDIESRKKRFSKSLISLGGHGKNGKLKCDDVRCPLYDKMVTMNDGKSFQSGCGFDPIKTGCCFEYEREELNIKSYTCSKCQDENIEIKENFLLCKGDMIQFWEFYRIEDIPAVFRDNYGILKICGRMHNPGATENDYFISEVPNARPVFSNNNWNSSRISDYYLCNRHEWEQGDYIDDAGFHHEDGIGSDFGLYVGRHKRVNFNNYVQENDSKEWSIGPLIEGEGIFECFNFGSCIGPDTCTCADGWSGFDCRTPLCRHEQASGLIVGCENGGICQNKDDCHCIQTISVLWKTYENVERGLTGWTGTDCSMPKCVQGYYDPLCDIPYAPGGEGCFRCANGGICTAPDKCECAEGWSGFDCRTPVCEVFADDLIRNQLMTVDEEKVKLFEKDPCGMKGFYKPDIINGVEYARGNCTLPNKCTCFCKGSYDERLCNEYGGDYCKTPFQDPLVLRRYILRPDENFGTRKCWSGYEGIVDENDFFQSCHMTIYEPSYLVRHTTELATWGCVLLVMCVLIYVYVKRRMHKRRKRAKIERRQSIRPVGELTGQGGSNAFTYRSINQAEGSSMIRNGLTNAFTYRSKNEKVS